MSVFKLSYLTLNDVAFLIFVALFVFVIFTLRLFVTECVRVKDFFHIRSF